MPSNPPVPEERPRPAVLGMRFDALTVPQALDRFFELAALPPGPRGCRIAATVNVDFVVNTYCATRSTPRNPALARVLRRAELVIADGMPLVWLSRLLGTPLPERVTGADLVPMIAERAARDHVKLYFLGGKEEYTRGAAEILTKRYPGLEIVGIDTPFVNLDAPDAGQTDLEICRRINESGASILLVGFGNPKQELWAERNRANLKCGIAVGIGGTFNFIAGAVKRAPDWMRHSGTEWIFRIIQEPGRLWKRYGFGLLVFNTLALFAFLNRPRKGGAGIVAHPDTPGVLTATGRGRFSPEALQAILDAYVSADGPVEIRGLSGRQRRQLRAHRMIDMLASGAAHD
ncbi:MAG: WecB/TagA/CpsF family glycosyltransferase [Lentisphaeria bacterium]|nr:WecB/TagA/CpsF family glycosyltransferase [Lentisphaeria bacterium]